MKSLFILGRRWFDRINGNTYCCAEVFIDGKLTLEIPYQYGYGSFYLQEAQRELEEKGFIVIEKYESLREACERLNIVFDERVFDVQKRDMIKERKQA